jgi:hypothetical protein
MTHANKDNHGRNERMFSSLRRRFTYANVAMTLALVFAMSGGAYAAKHYLITSTKQISPKVLKALQGKAGPAGAAGAQGPAGPQGPAGANGKDGANGANGTNGANGKSVASSPASGAECKEGGTKLEVEGSGKSEHVCNGKAGAIHPEETLLSEASETGTWLIFRVGEDVLDNISFVIPLAHPIAESKIKIEPEGYTGGGEGCPGSAEEAKAEPGFLCIYTTSNQEEKIGPLVVAQSSDDGAFLEGFGEEGKFAFGTWAVTAE